MGYETGMVEEALNQKMVERKMGKIQSEPRKMAKSNLTEKERSLTPFDWRLMM